MLTSFYDILVSVETSFFGSAIMTDTFFSGAILCFNALLLLSMFFGLFWFPFRWCIKAFLGWIDRGNK